MRKMEVLAKYGAKDGTFRLIYTGIDTHILHPYTNNYNLTSKLFQEVYSVEDNQYIVDYMFLNNNRTWEKLPLTEGDIVELNARTKKYRMGNEYHRNNNWRVIRDYYRILYPHNAEIIDHIDIKNPVFDLPVVDLRTGDTFSNYDKWFTNSSYRTNEDKELLLIHLIDNTNKELVLNRAGRVRCKRVPPVIMYKYVFDKLTDTE